MTACLRCSRWVPSSRPVRVRQISRAANSADTLHSTTLYAYVDGLLKSGKGHPYVGVQNAVAETLTFKNDLVQFKGKSNYLRAATTWWESQGAFLPEAKTEIVRLSQVSQDEVIVSWRLTWIRPSTLWLVQLFRSWPGIHVKYKTILDRYDQESKFSWAAVQKLFETAVKDRVLELPIAAVEGTSKLSFTTTENSNPYGWQLQQVTERTDLYQKFQTCQVKNRTITRDYLLFWYTRQPPGINFEDWFAKVRASINTESVPGMSPMEVDGVDAAQQSQLYEDGAAVLALLTVGVITVGLGFIWLSAGKNFL